MLKRIISYGLGMSSSTLTQHMKIEIKEKGWEDIDYDIALLCPHLMYYAKDAAKAEGIKIPMYIIPSLMYGKMNLQDLHENCEDLLVLRFNKEML